MPLHNLGYRPWTGSLVPRLFVWWSVADTGAKLALKSRWFRRFLIAAWLPVVYMGGGLYVYEMSAQEPGLRQVAMEFVRNISAEDQTGSWLSRFGKGNIEQRLRDERHMVWKLVLYTFFRYPQAFVMVVLVGMLAPPLIARDMRSRAYLLYFSRPIHIWEYIAGKAFVVLKYLLLCTAIPALLLYLVGICVSHDPLAITHTWDLPLRILGATVLLVIPTTMLALAISSLFTEVRYGVFAWFGIWIVGWVIYANASVVEFAEGDVTNGSPLSLFSLFHVLGNVQDWVFGMRFSTSLVMPSFAILTVITVVSTAIVYRQITKPIRA